MKHNIIIKILEFFKMSDMYGYIFVGTFTIFLLNIVLYIVANHIPSSIQSKTKVEQPYCFSKEKIWYGELTEIAVSDNVLYVLYDDKGIMECYDLKGEYLCSYGFFMIKNGKATMQVIDNNLYVRSRNGDMYSFVDTQFLQYYSHRNDRTEINNIFEKNKDNNLSKEGGKYEIRGASIWRKLPDSGWEMVISRPLWMVVMRGSNIMATHIICFLVMMILLLRCWQR